MRPSFVFNNPLHIVDPSGFGFRSFFRALFAGAAAVAATILTGGQVEVGAAVFVAIAGTAGAVAGDQVGAAIDRAVARSSSQSSPQLLAPQIPSLSPALASLAAVPLAATATATIVSVSAGGELGALTAGGLAVPGVGEVLGGVIAGILLYKGAVALREAYDEWNRGFEIVGYHATSFRGTYGIARAEGFKFNMSDRDGRARFGPGFYLSSTRQGAVAELTRRGLTVDAVLEVRVRLRRNIIVGGPLAERPYSRAIGAVVRIFQGSITYGSFADPGAINYVLFSPDQQEGSARVIQYGQQ